MCEGKHNVVFHLEGSLVGVIEDLVVERNLRSRREPITISDWVAIAIRERLEKQLRSRKSKKNRKVQCDRCRGKFFPEFVFAEIDTRRGGISTLCEDCIIGMQLPL